MIALWLLVGCGELFGPPVTCAAVPKPGAVDPRDRDLVCHADANFETYRVTVEQDGDFGPQTHHFGHHEVLAGEETHHDVRRGTKVTVEAEGYWPRTFIVR